MTGHPIGANWKWKQGATAYVSLPVPKGQAAGRLRRPPMWLSHCQRTNGLVHLDAQETPGLGRHLHHALGGRCAVMGVAKTAPPNTPAQFEVQREEETRPLIVSCIGIELGAAKARLRAMHGRKRVPTLLKLVARLAKAAD